MINSLQFLQAIDRLDLVSPTISALLKNWQSAISVNEIQVAKINPAFAGGKELCEQYGVSPDEGAICVIVEAIRGQSRTLAACVALVNYRIDFNGVVRKTLNARRVSLAPIEEVLKKTQMEYGSVTPIGLPADWPILIDERVIQTPRIIMGSGLVNTKLSLPSKIFNELNGVHIINGLGLPASK